VTWDRYLERFHASRPGITEAVLRRSLHTGGGAAIDPYRWLAEAVPARGRVLDLGCGSAPLWKELAGGDYVGLDTSDAELAAARVAGAGPLLRASATAIPLRDSSLDVVACSMSLMVFSPLPQALAETARVLRPGGRLVATIPAGRPLRGRDMVLVAGLLAALGRRPGYPAGRELGRLPAHLAQAGLRLAADERRRFGYRLRDAASAAQFLSSLYLPGFPEGRRWRAGACLRLLARFGTELPVPLRRIIAVKPG
jgi:SAM-dependent methyltransferase